MRYTSTIIRQNEAVTVTDERLFRLFCWIVNYLSIPIEVECAVEAPFFVQFTFWAFYVALVSPVAFFFSSLCLYRLLEELPARYIRTCSTRCYGVFYVVFCSLPFFGMLMIWPTFYPSPSIWYPFHSNPSLSASAFGLPRSGLHFNHVFSQ